ncbi:MAG: 23S rRNA (adenine(2030)-N(6))-methyltransferase RlmJ [Xanthomonadales bacterium]|nr:23S rRNA (adenine(2030)-N(6))-methyltransferase RlmJ [Xanthomonadales bacterium]
MNYRHAFHAGNFADVFKHVLLIGLLDGLKAKPAAFCYVDSHAGRGLYELGSDEAKRTGEYRDGVLRLLDRPGLPPDLAAYVALVRQFGGEDGALRRYPGSPLIAAACMREADRAIACEVQDGEAAALKEALRRDRRFAVHRRDGYEALKALLPPAQKRGLVLIDPPFEAQAAEFAIIQAALEHALRRWPNATYAVWYPIKQLDVIAPFHRWLARHAGHAIAAELLVHPANSPLRLNGCGLAIVNPPWQFEDRIGTWLPTLQGLLAAPQPGESRVLRLAGGA